MNASPLFFVFYFLQKWKRMLSYFTCCTTTWECFWNNYFTSISSYRVLLHRHRGERNRLDPNGPPSHFSCWFRELIVFLRLFVHLLFNVSVIMYHDNWMKITSCLSCAPPSNGEEWDFPLISTVTSLQLVQLTWILTFEKFIAWYILHSLFLHDNIFSDDNKMTFLMFFFIQKAFL